MKLCAIIPLMTISIAAFSADGENGIIPFHGIGGIVPGKMRLNEVIALYGAPEDVVGGNPQAKPDDKDFDKRVRYTSKGISILIDGNNVKDANPIVDSVSVESPFKGTAKIGLSIGMNWINACEILDKNYVLALDLNKSRYYKATKDGESTFQIWQQDGIVIRIKQFGG